MTAPALAPPRFLFPYVNQACNLRCLHCLRWQESDPVPEARISVERMCEIIEEFAELSPGAGVVICGGEPMLALDDYFKLCACCRRLGLRSYSVTNGTRIATPSMAERVLREGPDEVTVSLDSPDEGIHDSVRGVKYSYRVAVRALRLLVMARKRLGTADRRIYAMGLICTLNYQDLDRFYDFVLNDIGADKLKVNLLQPTCQGAEGQSDEFFDKHARVNPDEFMAILRACDVKYQLGFDPEWVAQMGMYYRSLWRNYTLSAGWAAGVRTKEHICNTYERNIMVNLQGVARLCFSPDYPGTPLVGKGDLRRFWEGEAAEAIRVRMRTCNRVCGISHSVRRVSATLKETKGTKA